MNGPRVRSPLPRPSSILYLLLWTCLIAWSRPVDSRVFDIHEEGNVDLDFSTRRGLRLRFDEPDLSFRVGGRLHYDFGFVEDDRTSTESFDDELRRARLYLDARALGRFRFMIDRELAPDRKGWRNVWAGGRILRRLEMRVGNFVAPLGLEDITASNHSTFMERALPSALSPSFQTGAILIASDAVGEDRTRNRWTLRIAVTSPPLGQTSDDRHRSDHVGLAWRGTFAPIAHRGRLLHLGAAFERRWLVDDARYRISSRPESSLLPRILNTGRLADVRTVTTYGLELALIRGPLTLQAEFIQSFLERSAGREDPSFEGGYGQISWVLTGEYRRYSRSSGLIAGVRPASRWGALELSARLSALNLNDETVKGGRALDLTLGASWYIRRNLRVLFNYLYVDAERRSDRRSDNPHVAQARVMVFF